MQTPIFNTPTEKVSHLSIPSPVLLSWLPFTLARLACGSSWALTWRVGCQSSGSDCGTWWRPGWNWTGRGLLALVSPLVVAGKLAASDTLQERWSRRCLCYPELLGGSFPCRGEWKLLRPRLWRLEIPESYLLVLRPGIHTNEVKWRHCRGWQWGCWRHRERMKCNIGG